MCVRRIALALTAFLMGMTGGCLAQNFDDSFRDQTLRLDYIFSGDNRSQQIYLDEMRKSEDRKSVV